MRIYQLEITNKCNFNCSYCPRQVMKRKIGFVGYRVLEEVANKIENNILRLHHYGESLLDNDLENKIMFLKTKKPNLVLILNTNGSLLTELRTKKLFNAGLNKIILSYHNEKSIKYIKDINYIYRERIEIIKVSNSSFDLSNIKKLGYETTNKRLRDLGQLKKEIILKGYAVHRCTFLKDNEVVVLWNGLIVPCCECFDDNYVIGNILIDNVVKNKEFEMCKTCWGYGNDLYETERE